MEINLTTTCDGEFCGDCVAVGPRPHCRYFGEEQDTISIETHKYSRSLLLRLDACIREFGLIPRKDINDVVVSGVHYEAVPVVDTKDFAEACSDCFSTHISYCYEMPPCNPAARKDGRRIVWKKVTETQPPEEQKQETASLPMVPVGKAPFIAPQAEEWVNVDGKWELWNSLSLEEQNKISDLVG